MAKRLTASDGTEFGIFNQGGGDYVAEVTEDGFHYAPPIHETLTGDWDDDEADYRLSQAVETYEHHLRRNRRA